MISPYHGASVEEWEAITAKLIQEHPLRPAFLVDSVLAAWEYIFRSSIGPARIGVDIKPAPQIMGFLLHELIPIVISQKNPQWRIGDVGLQEKDLHYSPNPQYSVEIKTSSSTRSIYGNRSYAQQSSKTSRVKSGYYLTVNFEKFTVRTEENPHVSRIRFGWLDHEDWIGQASQTGQQSHLTRDADRYKLRDLLNPR